MEGQDYTHYVRQDVNSLKIMNTEEMMEFDLGI